MLTHVNPTMTSLQPEEGKSWKEFNKIRKEKRKKWKEEQLVKKFKKEAAKSESPETNTAKLLPQCSTIAIAVPGSILDNAQSPELRTYLAGQIARAAAVFRVDEIVVFDDYGDVANAKKSEIEAVDGVKVARRCCIQLVRLLQYLECPQYLRKYFFPIHNDLKFVGVLNPLDTPHHLRQTNDFIFREGVVTNKPIKPGKGSQVNVGLLQDVHVDKLLTPGLRVTVKLAPQKEGGKKIRGTVVPPHLPRAETGVYWGYAVRLANSLAEVLSKGPYKNGYDLTIGTSDKGTSIDDFTPVEYNHALIVFGGLQGLEGALESDEALNVDSPSYIFDHYLNTLPDQGSRTIRTEEAILISLTSLRSKLNPKTKPKIKDD